MPIIATHALTKQFQVRNRGTRWGRRGRRCVTAVDHLDLSVEAGEAVGYIGANGAGKSTTIKMLMGILRPTSGQVLTCGLDPLRHRIAVVSQVGVVFGQRSQLWWDLPTDDSFTILGAIHALPAAQLRTRRAELVEMLDLGPFLGTPVRQLSLGQRMRTEIAAALLHQPRLLILDEPTIGLDVVSKQRLREFLHAQRASQGTTLMLTTHDMGDVERLCDRLVVVDQGRMVFDGDLAGLTALAGAQRVVVVDTAVPVELGVELPSLPGVSVQARDEGSDPSTRLRLAFDPELTSAAAVIAHVGAHATITDLAIEEPHIEDVVRTIYTRAAAG